MVICRGSWSPPNHSQVGGLEHEFYFSIYIGNVIIPTDELIFFRGVGQPPTRINWILDYQTTIIGY